MKRLLKAIGCLFIVLTICIVPLSSKTTVKVAYPIQKGLTEISDTGNFSGYTADYLRELERFTSFEFEFVTLDGNENEQIVSAMEKVQNGELDLMGGMIYDQSLTSMYDYTATNYGMGNMVLYVLADNTDINDTNVYSMKSLKVGILSSKKTDNPYLKQFGETNGINVQQYYYDSGDEMINALKNKEVDAISISEQSTLEGDYRIIAAFSPRPFYLVTTKGKTNIISELNDAMAKLNKEQPTLMSELHEKYFSLKNTEFNLTDNEKEFIKNHPVIDVALLGGRAPYQSQNNKGEVVGITIDVFNYISELSGIEFRYHYTESYQEYEKMISENQYMIEGGIISPYGNVSKDYSLSRPFLDSNIEIVMNKNLEATNVVGKRLALSKDTDYSGDLKGNIVTYDTPLDCIEAVENGEADYTYINSHTAMFYNSAFQYENINIIPQERSYNQKVGLAIRNDVSTPLLNIVNKGIDQVTTKAIQEIVFKNATYAKSQLTLVDFIKENPTQFISILVILLGLYFFSRYYTNRKNNQIMKKEYERFEKISALSGDCFLEYNVEKDTLSISGGGAKLMSNDKVISDYLKQNRFKVSRYVKQVLETKRTFNQDEYMEFLDGTKRWQSLFLQPIFDQQDKITHIIGKIADIQAQKEEQLLWRDLAQKDSLTKIYNSAACRELMDEFLSENDKDSLALIILDIDHFKDINDQYGHFYGDRVLQELAETLTLITKPTDILGRVGGDEFIIGLKYPQSQESVSDYCQNVMNSILSHVCTEENIAPTISMGVAFSRNQDSYDELYQLADKALYKVKASGRNNFEFYTE